MKQLLFVYNANSGLFNSLNDFAHKIISPQTYQCSLCALTYGNFSIKSEWKNFIQHLPVQTVFLHKHEFEKKHHHMTLLPAVFLKENSNIKQLISKEEIDNCTSLNDLKNLVTLKLLLHA